MDTPTILTATKPSQGAARKGRKREKLKQKVPRLSPLTPLHSTWFFLCVCNDDCGVSASSHNFEGHVHESHEHKTAGSPGHEEKREQEEQSRERTAEKRGNP